MSMWQVLALLTLVCCSKASESISQWPAGTYGIPKPTSGCPSAEGFQWQEGWRSQDTDGENSNNAKSTEFHLDGSVDGTKINRSFCMKTVSTGDLNRPAWARGKYCIYKWKECPAGLTQGFVKWDDDDTDYKLNDKGGTLPNGTYHHNTEIHFCCRTDGNKSHPILLSSKTPFFLLAYGSAGCQMIKWAIVTQEWIHYDTESDRNSDQATGAYPYDAGIKHPTIHYCYYRGCNETLTGEGGSFHSPNYPGKYPDGQYCSWRITVGPAQQIHLTFTNFSLQNEYNTDALYLYDGDNATGEVLGVFYGDHPPPKEGIYSSSNHMFLIFKSDGNDSYTGFSASYYECNFSVSTDAALRTSLPEVTSSFRTLHTSSPTEELSNISQENSRQSMKKGIIYGPVIGVLFAILVVFIIYVVWKLRKRQRIFRDSEASRITTPRLTWPSKDMRTEEV